MMTSRTLKHTDKDSRRSVSLNRGIGLQSFGGFRDKELGGIMEFDSAFMAFVSVCIGIIFGFIRRAIENEG
jgi:hypothetical protein